ncbi:MAG: hypothetical protein JWL63_1482 [Rhodocyclales bacterium]|nr:hypothetical protein [Rhodocyclales bacterium]
MKIHAVLGLMLALCACGGGGGGGGGSAGGGAASSAGSASSSAASSTASSSASSAASSSVSSAAASSATSSSAASSIAAGPLGVIGNTLCLNADGPAGQATYPRIESVLGTGAIESPSDTVYTPNRPHVVEFDNDGIAGPHFGILAIDPTDVNQDLVPITSGGDRSRTEIKIAPSTGGVQDGFKAHEGDTYVYTWRFRIAPGMKFSPSFTHIHQIKAYLGTFDDPPLITFTPLSTGFMDIRQIGDGTTSSSVFNILGSMPLAGVPGQWMDVREEITYSNTVGRYKLTIWYQNGTVALNIDSSGLQMWRTGSDHMRPKWGIYRKHHASLNQNIDDYIYFANFGITHGSTPASTCR